jgi:hypothetical protein
MAHTYVARHACLLGRPQGGKKAEHYCAVNVCPFFVQWRTHHGGSKKPRQEGKRIGRDE